jgi:hypothetical protein
LFLVANQEGIVKMRLDPNQLHHLVDSETVTQREQRDVPFYLVRDFSTGAARGGSTHRLYAARRPGALPVTMNGETWQVDVTGTAAECLWSTVFEPLHHAVMVKAPERPLTLTA